MPPTARRYSLQVSLALLLPLAAADLARAQQSQDFGSLPSNVSRAIEKDLKKQKGQKVLVLDFVEAQGAPTALGHALADAFSDSLSKETHDFGVADRSQLSGLFERDRLSPQTFQDHKAMTCYGPELDAQIVLEGELEDFSGGAKLTIDGWKMEPRKKIFEEKASLALTPEMQALLQKQAASFVISSADYTRQSGLPRSGEKGYSLPRCIQCHWPDFSDAAVAARAQGTIFLVIMVDATGGAENITVTRGLPCGLDQEATDAVKDWKFDPASGPDGKPADVEQEIEVRFRLF